MKTKFLSVLVIAFAICFVSCSKSNDKPSTPVVTHDTVVVITHDTLVTRDTVVTVPSNAIVGLWIGTLTAVNEPQAGPLTYSFDIRSDGTILTWSEGADGNTYYSAGQWTLSGTTFTATITSTTASNKGTVQNLAAVYNKANGTLSPGTWQNVAGNASGTFSLSRIN